MEKSSVMRKLEHVAVLTSSIIEEGDLMKIRLAEGGYIYSYVGNEAVWVVRQLRNPLSVAVKRPDGLYAIHFWSETEK